VGRVIERRVVGVRVEGGRGYEWSSLSVYNTVYMYMYTAGMSVCVISMSVYVCICAYMCVHACAHVCISLRVCVHDVRAGLYYVCACERFACKKHECLYDYMCAF